jgi:undecaprenyl-diphosphatase
MNMFETIILGLIQGLTEFVPISSSGHLVIAQNLFSGASDHLFLEWINIGTLLALLVYFRHRIIDICRDVFIKRDYRLARNILITAIPAGAIGFMLSDFIDKTPFFGSLLTVTVTLAVVGVIMVVLERLPMKSKVDKLGTLSPWRALVVGVVQMFALIPGVSRSGSTIIAGRLMGLSPALAAEYSFLASLPIMFGVTLKLIASSSDRQYFADHLGMLVVSNGFAFVSGVIAVGFLMKYLSKHSLAVFGWYRIGLAAVLAIVILIQSI